jgi:hypothetical protein
MTEAEWLACDVRYTLTPFVLDRRSSYRKVELLNEAYTPNRAPAEVADAIRCVIGNPLRLATSSLHRAQQFGHARPDN